MTKHFQSHLIAMSTRRILRLAALMMLCAVAVGIAACGDSGDSAETEVQAAPTIAPTATPEPEPVHDDHDDDAAEAPAADDSDHSDGESSEESKSDDHDHDDSSASSGEAGEDHDHDSDADDSTVSNSNQVTGSDSFGWSQNEALLGSEPLNIVDWTQQPTLSLGALDASGVLKGGTVLFDPTVGEGAAFAIYHVNYDSEPMLVILPNLGPMSIWDTDFTVAEMDYEFEAESFTFTAYSPLFFDATPSDLKLHVYGFDSDGNPALLAVSDIGFGDGIMAEPAEPAHDHDHEDGEDSSSASSDEDSHDHAETNDDDVVVSNENQIAGGYAFEWTENQALVDAEPLDVVTWTSGPTLGLGELYGEGTLDIDAVLFSPMLGEGAALAVYHVNYDSDPMIVLLPSLGPTMIWETDHTVAEMDYEIDGRNFTFRAYSPLFFDGNAADIKLRIYGYDENHTPSLLAISNINPE